MNKLLAALLLAAIAGPILADQMPPLPDPPSQYPAGELGRMVKLGEDIIMNTNTHPMTKDLVGNKLTCNSCHIDGGKAKTLGTFIGSATAFPAFSGREKTVQTLQDRINNCFMRSMNGKRPIIDSEASIAMAAYVTWLSEGLPMKMNATRPITPYIETVWPDKEVAATIKSATHDNYVRGKKVYAEKCAACHGADGQGVADFPPLWGKQSYNAGAGMSNPIQMGTWVKHNMPMGNPDLSSQEAADVSLFVDAQPRPDFVLQDHLLPKEQMGFYNSKVLDEKATVRSNFKARGLDVDAIRGDRLIP